MDNKELFYLVDIKNYSLAGVIRLEAWIRIQNHYSMIKTRFIITKNFICRNKNLNRIFISDKNKRIWILIYGIRDDSSNKLIAIMDFKNYSLINKACLLYKLVVFTTKFNFLNITTIDYGKEDSDLFKRVCTYKGLTN